MRGAQIVVVPVPALTGIIPADAGSTRHHIMRGLLRQDHPRGFGEHSSMMICVYAQLGSSPRMRGAPCCPGGDSQAQGIIPADAGSTLFSWMYWTPNTDHPRGCGEHSSMMICVYAQLGSSPRMRGAHSLTSGHLLTRGIIPADAGSTCGSAWIDSPVSDHPRGCGEHASTHVDSRPG